MSAQPEVLEGSQALGVRLQGELTMETAPALVEALGEVARTHAQPMLLIDLREVTFLDSTCLSALIEARRAQQDHGGTLSVLVTEGTHVSDLFRITGTRETLGVRDDADGPLESLVG
jgi:anti-anti-sigma factor